MAWYVQGSILYTYVFFLEFTSIYYYTFTAYEYVVGDNSEEIKFLKYFSVLNAHKSYIMVALYSRQYSRI